MTTGNGGFQSELDIYVDYLLRFSHLQSSSCGSQPWTGPELFAKKNNNKKQNNNIFFSCNFFRTDRKQVINNKIGETVRGEVIMMLGCVKMAYLDVPSRDRSRNVEETSATDALPCTIVLTPC